jgi:co-chaperonin GroES (HSP10)
MKYTLEPKNKHIVIKAIGNSDKVGTLYIPSTANHGTYGQAQVIAVASDCDPAPCAVGDTIIYDTIGSVDHRVGNQGFTTVKALNVVAVVKQEAE